MPVRLRSAVRRAAAAAGLVSAPAVGASAQPILATTPPPVPPFAAAVPDGYLSRVVSEYTFSGCTSAGSGPRGPGPEPDVYVSGAVCVAGRAVWGVRADGGPPQIPGLSPETRPYTLLLAVDKSSAYPVSRLLLFVASGTARTSDSNADAYVMFYLDGPGITPVGQTSTFERGAWFDGAFSQGRADPESFRLTRINFGDVGFAPLGGGSAIVITGAGISTVPEPGTLALAAVGLAAAGAAARRRRA